MMISVLYLTFTAFISLPAAQNADTTCSEPPEIEFASITSKTPEKCPVGTTISYTCQFGYVSDVATKTSQCVLSKDGESAEWSKLQMSCIPRSCDDPGFVTNGHRMGSLFTFSNSVTFQCNEGFQLIGKAMRYCHASGSWSGSLPHCERIYCDLPNDPEHGQVTYTSLEYGSELKFKCDPGYRLNTEPVICTGDRTWSRMDSICVEALCDFPETPDHGFVNINSSNGNPVVGTLAVFSCEGDRIPDGPTTSKCLDIGKWTFPAPNCLVLSDSCKIPAVSNGKIGRYSANIYNINLFFSEIAVGTDVENNKMLFLRCTEGYTPLGSTAKQTDVICSDGKWSKELFCEPSGECHVPWIPNAQIKQKKTEIRWSWKKLSLEKTVIFKNVPLGTIPSMWMSLFLFCNSGYNLQGTGLENVQIHCSEGRWSPNIICIHNTTCSSESLLSLLPQGVAADMQYITSDTPYHSTVRLICKGDLILVGNPVAKCIKDGKWYMDSVQCISGCLPFTKSSESKLIMLPLKDSYSFGESLILSCPLGLYLNQELQKIMCLSTGWSETILPDCVDNNIFEDHYL